jgi:TerC family integral membrane protein
LGICGAVFFRLAFIFIGEYLMHTMVLTHFVFGGFLVYTGINTVMADDDDDDPSQNALVQWLQARLPFIQFYDQSGAFFVKVPVNEAGQVIMQQTSGLVPPSTPSNAEAVEPLEAGSVALEPECDSYGTVDTPNIICIKSGSKSAECATLQTRATMLFLVVCCLEISDMIFAVDSVSAIVAQVNDLFLAYTSAVFAMLGLRATFFIIDVLVHMFSLLKYGVAAVLVFIGVKLCLSHVYPISPHIVVLFLFLAIGGSMMASVVAEELEKKAEGEHFSDVDERVEKVKHMHNSPVITETTPCAA